MSYKKLQTEARTHVAPEWRTFDEAVMVWVVQRASVLHTCGGRVA